MASFFHLSMLIFYFVAAIPGGKLAIIFVTAAVIALSGSEEGESIS